MSSMESMATPTRPTSPRARTSSESRPKMCIRDRLDVEQRADNLALAIVAHAAVCRVFVGTIKLDPRVEACLFQRMYEAPWSLIEVSELAAEVIEVLLDRAQVREPEHSPVVVARRPLEPPQKSRVALLPVAIGCEAGRPDALDVPDVEDLVSDERQGVKVRIPSGERSGRNNESRAGAVLEAASPPWREVEQELVRIVGELSLIHIFPLPR